eukprot:1136707-Pelagomonas_calceolata.AAC.3
MQNSSALYPHTPAFPAAAAAAAAWASLVIRPCLQQSFIRELGARDVAQAEGNLTESLPSVNSECKMLIRGRVRPGASSAEKSGQLTAGICICMKGCCSHALC